MTSLRCLVALQVFVLCLGFGKSLAQNGQCLPNGSTAGWKTYVDRIHGYCLLYPPSYKRVSNRGHETNRIAFTNFLSGASIFTIVEDKPFDLSRLVDHAPTGYDSPPDPIAAGPNTFYYYGPGGGGVSYPDQYFFDLLKKTLYITFDGPYINDKTPSGETKKIEATMLATFRVF